MTRIEELRTYRTKQLRALALLTFCGKSLSYAIYIGKLGYHRVIH